MDEEEHIRLHQRFLGMYPYLLVECRETGGHVDMHGTVEEARQMIRWAKRSLRLAKKKARQRA